MYKRLAKKPRSPEIAPLYVPTVQWGRDNEIDDTVTSSYTITLPLAMSVGYVAVTGSTGDDLTNIESVGTASIRVHTCQSLNTSPNYKVKRPAYFITIGVL